MQTKIYTHKKHAAMVAEHLAESYICPVAAAFFNVKPSLQILTKLILIHTCKGYGQRAHGWQLNKMNIIMLLSQKKSGQIHKLFHVLVARFML